VRALLADESAWAIEELSEDDALAGAAPGTAAVRPA